MAQRQDNPGTAIRRRVVPVANLFRIPNDSLAVDSLSPTRPLLCWPPSHRAAVTRTGGLRITERGRVVRRFAAGQWNSVGRLINIRPEDRSVIVIELEAGAEA